MAKKMFTGIDYTSLDYEGFRNDMVEALHRRIPEYSDFSEADFGIVMIEMFAHGLDVLSYYLDRHANEMFLETCKDKKSALKIARQLGYTPAYAKPAKFYQVFEVDASPNGYVIPKGMQVMTENTLSDAQIIYEVESDYVIPPNVTGLEKVGNEYLYQVPIVQGSTVYREILGTSDGTAGQEFTLGYSDVIMDSIVIEVYNDGVYESWTMVNNFLSSESDSKHFTAQIDEYDVVTVKFGDGVDGMIPNTYENGIVVTYRVGVGSKGNVSANKITVLSGEMAGVLRTFNPSSAYEEGTDGESLEEIKRNAPASIRTMDRAVTLEDHTNIVMLSDKLASANTLRTGTLEATVYVIEKDATDNSGYASLDNDLKSSLQTDLQSKAMVGCTALVSPAKIKYLNMTIKYRATDAEYSSSVASAISSRVHDMLDLGKMKVGQPFYVSDVIAELTDVDTGVDNLRSVLVTAPTNDILLGNTDTSTTLTGDEVIVLATLTVEEL